MRQTLVSWAATSCFLILAVAALRAAFGKRMGAGLRYALWGVVLVRLLVPVQLFTSPVVGTVIEAERIVVKQTQTGREVLDARPVESAQDGLGLEGLVPYVPEMSPPEPPSVPEPPQAPDWTKLPAALGWAWLAGSAVTAVVLTGCNLNFWLRLRRTRRPLEEQRARDVRPYTHLPVYTAQGLPSPCLFGVFRPAVYVAPETAADPAALRHVLAHEGTHASHGDHIWSLLRCAALCVHWWNPLVWLAAKLSRRDGELACDEGALKRLGDGERTAYGRTLLALVTGKAVPGGPLLCSTAMTGDKKSLKERFARIAQAPRRAAGIAAAAVILAALVTVCAFGQKTSAPTPWEELDADLSISMEDDAVRITGTVDGVTLARRGAFWHSGDREYSFSGSPYGELSLIYPAFTEGIEGHLLAWWADESHTAVNLSTYLMATLSSYWPSGYWEFTVDFSGGEAVVSRMEAIASFPEGMEVQMHPKTIPDEEAVRAGRIAARLLTAAEEYYRDWEEKGGVPPETAVPSDSPDAQAESELNSHFQTDGDLVGVPWEVVTSVGEWVRKEYEDYLKGTPPSASGMPFVDDWRITNFDGPWRNMADGETVEVWRINYEFHEPEPDPNRLAGGMYLTDDGWLCPTCPNCSYSVFSLDGAGQRHFEGTIMQNVYSPDDEARFNVDQFFASMAYMLDISKARAELKAALLGEAEFTFYNEQGQPTSLDINSAPQTVFPLTGEYGEIWSFVVIDLDGDGVEEVVLHIGGVAGDAGGYLVLRWAGPGDVRGYSSYWRNFWDLKTDGTFYYDYYMGITGLARVSFPAPGYTMEQHALAEGREDMSAHTDPPTGTFTVDGAPVTLEEYLAALERQDEKPDAAWYEFTRENVERVV